MMNYLGICLLSTTEIGNPIRKLTSTGIEWTWKNTFQKVYKLEQSIIKKDTSMN